MATQSCPYFGTCGGCSLQHIDYAVQLANKTNLLAKAIGFDGIRVFSGSEYHYRSRMDFIFHAAGIGLRKKGAWDKVIDIKECAIANDKLNAILRELREHFRSPDFFDLKRRSGTFRYAVIRTPGNDSAISFVLNSESARLGSAVESIREFAATTTANNVVITYATQDADESAYGESFVVKGSGMLRETLMGKEFLYPAQGFFQNNPEVAEKMQYYCNGLLKPYSTSNATLLDIYAGVGVFGIVNAPLFKNIVIVEGVRQCIDAANKNIKNNRIGNAAAVLLDAKQLKKLTLEAPLFIITDPPRSGMHPETINQLNKLKPELMLYVSCNPRQLGKDIKKFKSYKIKSAALFDMFPQTAHIEAVVELVRS